MGMLDHKKELEDLIHTVVSEGGSDLHISEGRHPAIRVNGDLIPLLKKAVLSKEDTMGLLSRLLSKERVEEFLNTMEMDFSYSSDGARFRGNAFFQQGTVGIALRLIPHKIKTLAELNLPDSISEFSRKKQGFFLVVGPVGQGKTTTLAGLIDLINKERTEHIITIEDPIEYVFEQDKSIIDQREVRTDTHDFQAARRACFDRTWT